MFPIKSLVKRLERVYLIESDAKVVCRLSVPNWTPFWSFKIPFGVSKYICLRYRGFSFSVVLTASLQAETKLMKLLLVGYSQELSQGKDIKFARGGLRTCVTHSHCNTHKSI